MMPSNVPGRAEQAMLLAQNKPGEYAGNESRSSGGRKNAYRAVDAMMPSNVPGRAEQAMLLAQNKPGEYAGNESRSSGGRKNAYRAVDGKEVHKKMKLLPAKDPKFSSREAELQSKKGAKGTRASSDRAGTQGSADVFCSVAKTTVRLNLCVFGEHGLQQPNWVCGCGKSHYVKLEKDVDKLKAGRRVTITGRKSRKVPGSVAGEVTWSNFKAAGV